MTQEYICDINALDDNACLQFEIGDKSYFVVNYNGAFYGYLNACPHLNIELNWQENAFLDPNNALIQCATHGALFTIDDGLCVSGPCVNQKLTPISLIQKENKLYSQT